ncbi:MAG: hypothetical protein IIA45_05235 [Bacteroidetes bacterium]|nr:hypothetical protein [Bacteroidota bacterium]
MRLNASHSCLIVVFLLTIGGVSAQTTSPYSYFGIGDLQSTAYAANRSMGGIAMALSGQGLVNISNPASYAENGFTTFNVGLRGKGVTQQTSTLSRNEFNAALGYLSLAVPVSKKWGMNAGLIPFSDMSYDFADLIIDSNFGEVNNRYSGIGTLYKAYLGSGVKVFSFKKSAGDNGQNEVLSGEKSDKQVEIQQLRIGANVSYLFGKLEDTTSSEFADSSNFFNVRKRQVTTINDLVFDLGVQYSVKLKEDIWLTIGGSLDLSSQLNAKRNFIWETYKKSGFGPDIVKDTLLITDPDNNKGIIVTPTRIGTGFAIENGKKWLIGMDFNFTDWSKYDSFGDDGPLNNSWEVRFGTQIMPDPKAVNNYWKIVNYRFGAYYTTEDVLLKNTTLADYGVTIGLGLPSRNRLTNFNVSVELGQKGTTDNNLIRETYIQTTLGFAFNDRWFIKRKFF